MPTGPNRLGTTGRAVPGLWVCTAAVVLAVPSSSRASEVRAQSRTIGEAYMVRMPGPQGQLVGRRRLSQYVNLGVYELLPPREPDELRRAAEDGQLQIVSSMRLRHDFGSFVQSARGDGRALLASLDDRQIDLLFGYLEGRRLGGWVDFKAGRQFEMSGLDFYAFDGGWVRVATPAHIAVEAFGGLQVDGTSLFGFPTFELDGTQGTSADDSMSPMVGAAFSLDAVKFADARFAYRRTWSPESINGDIADVDRVPGVGTVVDQEIVSASVMLRLAKERLSPFAAARYNLGTSRLDDLSAGVWWSITDIHSVRAQYLRTIPAFDLDSIWNVFASEPFEDVRVTYQVQTSPHWAVYGRFQGRFFGADATAALGTEPEDETVFGGGGGAGTIYRRRRFGMRADFYGLGGEGGTRVGGSIDTRTHVWYDRLALDARFYGLYYDDDLQPDRTGYSVALQAGLNAKLAHGIYLNVIGEELFTPFLDHSFRVFGMFSFDWAFRVGQR